MSKKRPTICMLTTSNLVFDTRILNEAHTLAKIYDLTIVTFESDALDLKMLPFKIKQVRCFGKKGVIKSLFSLARQAFKENTDIYHAHDLDGLFCAYLPALLKGKTLIYDSHELWSDALQFGRFKKFKRVFSFLEWFLVLRVKFIITVNESLSKILAEKYHKKVFALYNYPAVIKRDLSKKSLRQKYPGKKIIIYLGGITKGRGINLIVQVAKLLDQNFIFLLIGYGSEKENIEKLIIKQKMENKVKILDPFAPGTIVPSVAGADLGLCLIERISLSYYLSTPNKLFQYINADIPILASNFPEMKKIILEDNIGDVVSPVRPKEVARKIKELTSEPKHQELVKNLSKVKRKYSWQVESKKLIKNYLEILKS